MKDDIYWKMLLSSKMSPLKVIFDKYLLTRQEGLDRGDDDI